MTNENNTRTFTDSIGGINDKYIAEAEEYCVMRSQRLTRFTAIAAAVVIVLGAVFALTQNPTSSFYIGGVPTYDGAYLTAEQLDELFSATNDSYAATNAYTTYFAPSIEQLYIGELPTDEYATVWKYMQNQNKPDKTEFDEVVSEYFQRICMLLGKSTPEYTVKENSVSGAFTTIIDSTESFNSLSAYENSSFREVMTYAVNGEIISVNGEELVLVGDLSDAEIFTFLSDVKESLFGAFNVEFDSQKIERGYGNDEDSEAKWIRVIYYNSSNYPADGDRISILFNSDKAPEGFLYATGINYTDYSFELEDAYTPLAECRIITLDEAETLLKLGCVFGGHSCPICMSQQSAVDFSDYDYVGFEYVSGGTNDEDGWISVPFYAFYLDIGETEGGNRIYAQTFVPAVEIKGLDEYFDMQKTDHRSSAVNEVIK